MFGRKKKTEDDQAATTNRENGDQMSAVDENNPLIHNSDDSDDEIERIRDIGYDDWMRRAYTSEASSRIDRVLGKQAGSMFGGGSASSDEGGENTGQGNSTMAIKALKSEMFKLVYSTMGDEIKPEDMRSVLVVKTEKYHPYLLCLLNTVFCCMFSLFRPKDDESVLVLTKKQRVIMYKNERVGFRQNFMTLFTTARNFVLVFVFVTLGPTFFGAIVSSNFVEQELVFVKSGYDYVHDHTYQKLEDNLRYKVVIQIVVFIGALLVFSFICWSKCPHDFGTRYRQSHAANKICCAQFALSRGGWSRTCQMRLFFGRFPEQNAIDFGMPLRGATSCGPVHKDNLSIRALGRNPFASGNLGMILFFSGMLFFFSVIDWYMTYVWIIAVRWKPDFDKHMEFCRVDAKADPSLCTVEACKAHVDAFNSDKDFKVFCESVRIYEDEGNCQMYDAEPGCCGGCFQGAWKMRQSKHDEWFGLFISLIVDILTVAQNLAAVASALSYTDEKDHVDIKFSRRLKFTNNLANFLLTQPLAVSFFYTIFDSAYKDPDETGSTKFEKLKTSTSLHKQGRFDDLGGGHDEQNAANFQDVKNFEIDDVSTTWDDFFKKSRMVINSENKWVPKIMIPRKCLGIPPEEVVLGAWAERPAITFMLMLPYFTAAVIFWVVWAVVEHPITNNFGVPEIGKFGNATLFACIIIFVAWVVLSITQYISVKHVIILTNLRVFYPRYREKCACLGMFTVQLRLDVFRHDHEISYGQMVTNPPTCYMRLSRVPWTPGKIYIQPGIYGLLQVQRLRGNVLNIYQLVSQLTNYSKPYINEQDIKDAGISWEHCINNVSDALEKRLSDVWTVTHMQADDLPGMTPDIFLSGPEEKPLFYWSFKEIGSLQTPYNTNTDVVVTTGRIYIYKRDLFKAFDCKLCCCFFSPLWCSCWKRLVDGPKRLRRQSSFLDLQFLLSFSTEVAVTLPDFFDPLKTPVIWPCFDTCCRWVTLCMSCSDKSEVECNKETCSIQCRRQGPRAQLWLMWRHRYNSSQPDLACALRPFEMKDKTVVNDCMSKLPCCGKTEIVRADTQDMDDDPDARDYAKIEMLRKIMGVIQDKASVMYASGGGAKGDSFVSRPQ